MFNVKELSWIPIMCALLFAPTLCLAAAGDLDLTFGYGGLVTTDIPGSTNDFGRDVVAIQADGKIVMAGRTQSAAGWDFALARYNPDGTLDTGFGADGQVTTDFGASHDEAYGVVIQTDGKILVAGASYVPSTGWDFALARYNSDGTLDNSFGTDGKVTTDFSSGSDFVLAVAIQADGKIVVVGTALNSNPTPHYDFALARYNSDGTLDASFGNDGKVITDFSSGYDSAWDLAIQADGKIVVAGSSIGGSLTRYDFALARYNSDGTLDTGFGDGGKVNTDFATSGDRAFAIAIQADGKLVVAGSITRVTGIDFALARYNPDGTLNSDFGSEGLVTTDFASGTDVGFAVDIQADGKIVVAGVTNGSGYSNTDIALARYHGVRSPSELLEALIVQTQELVSSGDLNNGNGNALLVKLQAAIQQMDRDNHGAATNQMQAFINQVEGFIGAGVLTLEEGQPLIDAALAAVGGLAKREGGQLATTELPISFSLSQNYPNPFNPTTTIAYSLPEAGTVTVTVYDLLGREVQTLADGFQTAGAYVITWDGHTSAGDAAASGVYFYRLVSNSQVESRKMVLMK